MNDIVNEILKGSYDLNTYAGPDTKQDYRLDVLEAARHAYESQMTGFVLKSDHHMTSPLSYVLNCMYPGLTTTGAIVLNPDVGGLNPYAVETAVNLKTKMVCMPTYGANFYMQKLRQSGGIKITNNKGKLTENVHLILEIISHHDMVLASGNISPKETIELFKEANIRGISHKLATNTAKIASRDEQREIISYGAYLEYTFLSCTPYHAIMSPTEWANDIYDIGVEHCVVTTNFGQWQNPPAAEGMRMAISTLLQEGMSSNQVTTLVKTNPLCLINLTCS